MQHPQWIEDIPWWVKYLFLFGGGLMSAFSSNFPPLLQVAGLWTGIISATSGAIAVAWHRTNVWRAKHGKSKLKMDPSYVIILGLLVAAGGVIWQQLRTPQTGELTVTPVPAASSRGSFSLNPRYLSSAQKDALSDALGKISSVINTQGKEAVYVTANIKVFGSPDRKNLQLAIQQFGKSHDLAEAVYAAIYGDDGVLKKNPDFPELIAIVEYTGVVERFEYMARDIADALTMIDQNYERVIDSSKFALLIPPHHLRASQETTALNDWINTVNERIALTRTALLK